MKVSLNWLRQYLDIDLDPEAIGKVLTGTGLEVEGIDKIESIPGGLADIVVGHVLECGKHPNADRLSLTQVDIGDETPLSIVCGAPNVAAGQYVIVAKVGATLHPIDGEPFKIKRGKIRGEVSEGMICAEDEIGLGNSHAGIIVLEKPFEPGTPASEVFKLKEDYVYDIGLTPNRSDATNHLGVAFDLAAALNINHNHNVQVTKPDVSDFEEGNSLPPQVTIADSNQAPRYAGIVIDNLTVAPSPEWLRNYLLAIDVRPINNVVDVTNFVLHELGQPLHAFDLDRIGDEGIRVEKLPEGSTFISLDEVERVLSADDLMICDAQHHPLCIAGVCGGSGSGVTDDTTRIFLESAHFEAGTVRRSSMRHTLRTDAARVFEKGSDPNIAVYALKRAALLLQELAGGAVSSKIVDIYPVPVEPRKIVIRDQRINDLIGTTLTRKEVKHILQSMGMDVSQEDDESMTVSVPTNKSDVLREVDVIEEILRIYGFNNVPIPQEITTAMVVAPQPDPHALSEIAGDLLAANGYLEMMALSLSQSIYYRDSKEEKTPEHLVRINNTSNTHLDIMRPDMLMSALETVAHNRNRQQHDLALFEFGRTYRLDKGKYKEEQHLSLTLAGNKHQESWHPTYQSDRSTNYYSLKAIVHLLLDRFGIEGYRVNEAPSEQFTYGTRYHKGPMTLVDFGLVSASHPQTNGLIKDDIFFADFHWKNLLRVLPRKRVQVKTPSKYPTVRRDLALVLDQAINFSGIERLAKKSGKALLKEVNLFDVYRNAEQLGEDKKSYAISFLFESNDKTLKDKDVEKIMRSIENLLTKELGAEVRR